MTRSIAKNYLWNLLSQGINFLFPIVLLPYLSRIVGSNGVGEIAFVLTITSYFSLFAGVGMQIFGNRVLSYYNNLAFSQHVIFSTLSAIQIFFGIFFSILYALYILIYFEGVSHLYLIPTLYVLSAGLDFSWYFFATSRLKSIAIRNFVVKVFALLLIVSFVKTERDLPIYLFLYSVSFLMGNFFIIYSLPKQFLRIKISKSILLSNIKPFLMLLLPQMVMLIYTSFDKILLGLDESKFNLGIYDTSIKILSVLTLIPISLSPIMVTEISKASRFDDKELIITQCTKSILISSYLSLPILFGLMSVAPFFIYLFLGTEFDECVEVLYTLSPIIFLTSVGNVFVNQIMVALKKDHYFSFVMIIMVILTVVLNLILIPRYNYMGAAYASLISHVVILFLEILLVREYVRFGMIYKDILKIVLASGCMFVLLFFANIGANTVFNLVLQVLCGFLFFLLFGFLFKIGIQRELFNLISTLLPFKRYFGAKSKNE